MDNMLAWFMFIVGALAFGVTVWAIVRIYS